MAESASQKASPFVSSWTELQIPISKTIEDRKSEDGKTWLKLTTYHSPEKTPGFKKACFGRVTESPETVWYITAWESQDSLDKFENSEDYKQQREEHSKLSSAPLKTHHCEVRSFFWEHLTDNIGILDAYFPKDVSQESKQIVDNARGLVYHFAPGGSRPSAYRHRPTRGWIHGTQEYQGQEAAVLRFIHFWKSEESEKQFKTSSGITVSPGSRYLTLYDHLLEQLKEAGSLGHREFHCKLVGLPNYYRDPADYALDDDSEDYEA